MLGKCQFVVDNSNAEAHILYDFTSMRKFRLVNEQKIEVRECGVTA